MTYNLSIKFAETERELSLIAGLRYKVFRDEFKADGDSFDHFNKLEWGPYDDSCKHILCMANFPDKKEIAIGTFRIRTLNNTDDKYQIQSEFNIDKLLERKLNSCELGRICIDSRFRNGIILFEIWLFLFNYLREKNIEIVIGVGSFMGCDLTYHMNSIRVLFDKYVSPETKMIKSTQEINENIFENESYNEVEGIKRIPDILKAYLRFGCRVAPYYYIDYEFRTIDVCCVLLIKDIPNYQQKMLKKGFLS